MNWVYYMKDESDVVAYVGTTTDLTHRMIVHRNDSPWWEEIKSITATPHPTRVASYRAERAEIARLTPRYNVTGAIPRQDMNRKSTRVLTWLLYQDGPLSTRAIAEGTGVSNAAAILNHLAKKGDVVVVGKERTAARGPIGYTWQVAA